MWSVASGTRSIICSGSETLKLSSACQRWSFSVALSRWRSACTPRPRVQFASAADDNFLSPTL